VGFILRTILFEAFYTLINIYCSVCTNTCESLLSKFNQNQKVLACISLYCNMSWKCVHCCVP